MYFIAVAVATGLLAERTSAFQFGFPGITSPIFKPSTSRLGVEDGVHFPKEIIGNRIMVGNNVFLDSELNPVHDINTAFGMIPNWDEKIQLLKKVVDPSVALGYEYCPITGKVLPKVEQFKKLFNLLNCDSDHINKLFDYPTSLGGLTNVYNAKKLFECIGGTQDTCTLEQKKFLTALQMILPEMVKTGLFTGLHGVTGLSDLMTTDITGMLAAKKVTEMKKLLVLLAMVKPDLLHHIMKTAECSMMSPICDSKVLLDVKEFDDKFLVSLDTGYVTDPNQNIHITLDKEKKLTICTPSCTKAIPLPKTVDVHSAESIFHNGILKIQVNKIGGFEGFHATDKHVVKVNVV